MNLIFDMVKNIAIYLVLVTIIMNLLGKSSYKKYVSVFTGMLLIVIVISPMLKLFQMGNKMDYFFDKNLVSIETEEMTEQLIGVEDSQKEQILSGYKERIGDQIGDILLSHHLYPVNCMITLEEDETNKNYGAVKSIEVTACYTITEPNIEKISETTQVKAIEEVNIDKVNLGDSEISQESYDKIDSLEKKEDSKKTTSDLTETEIAGILAEFYGMSSEMVLVKIVEV